MNKDIIIERQANENLKLVDENEKLKQELKNKPDAKYTLTTADGKEFTIIQSERIDIQQELNNTILDLKQRIDKSIEYIKENCMFHNENNEECYCNYGDNLSPKKLVDILKGSEDNE